MEEKNKDNLDRLSIKVSQLYLISVSVNFLIGSQKNQLLSPS